MTDKEKSILKKKIIKLLSNKKSYHLFWLTKNLNTTLIELFPVLNELSKENKIKVHMGTYQIIT